MSRCSLPIATGHRASASRNASASRPFAAAQRLGGGPLALDHHGRRERWVSPRSRPGSSTRVAK